MRVKMFIFGYCWRSQPGLNFNKKSYHRLVCLKSHSGLCLRRHPDLICYQLLYLKSSPGKYLKKANSACVLRKFFCMQSHMLLFISVFVICIFDKWAVFIFVLINVPVLYWRDFFCEKTKQENVYDITTVAEK